jgi:hypothetical protein
MENKITNLPEKIYLQITNDNDDDELDFNDCYKDAITWASERIFKRDPCYVHDSALQALETALTEKHRVEVDGLKTYVKHYNGCGLYTFMGRTCTCGLDQLLTTQPTPDTDKIVKP